MDKEKAIEDLAFIKKVIDDSKKIIIDNGIGFIVWGILIATGLLTTYISIKFNVRVLQPWNWVILISVGWIISFADVFKSKKHNKVKTLSGKILGSIWFATGITLTILGFIAINVGAINSAYICPIFGTMLGTATFISARLYEEKWVSIFAITWWIVAIFMFYVPGLYTLLLMAVEMLILQVLPGIILYKRYKNQEAHSNEKF